MHCHPAVGISGSKAGSGRDEHPGGGVESGSAENGEGRAGLHQVQWPRERSGSCTPSAGPMMWSKKP